MKNFVAMALALGCAVAASGSAYSHPVIYTLTTVSDGTLGSLGFTQAVVTIRMRGDSRNIQNNSGVYTNSGQATVSVTTGGRTTSATFNDGQIFARLDSVNGVVGFGSAVSPTYPISLGCGIENCLAISSPGPDPDNYWGYDYGTLGGLIYQGATGNAAALSDEAQSPNLTASLSQATVLTGTTTACAVTYGPGTCNTQAPVGLQTDKGGFYLQDLYATVSYAGAAGQDALCNNIAPTACNGNTGTFTVEAIVEKDH